MNKNEFHIEKIAYKVNVPDFWTGLLTCIETMHQNHL